MRQSIITICCVYIFVCMQSTFDSCFHFHSLSNSFFFLSSLILFQPSSRPCHTSFSLSLPTFLSLSLSFSLAIYIFYICESISRRTATLSVKVTNAKKFTSKKVKRRISLNSGKASKSLPNVIRPTPKWFVTPKFSSTVMQSVRR